MSHSPTGDQVRVAQPFVWVVAPEQARDQAETAAVDVTADSAVSSPPHAKTAGLGGRAPLPTRR
jgi:hypothetical protein